MRVLGLLSGPSKLEIVEWENLCFTSSPSGSDADSSSINNHRFVLLKIYSRSPYLKCIELDSAEEGSRNLPLTSARGESYAGDRLVT